jgi:drug/metabolite transporter (DMT)-like permease
VIRAVGADLGPGALTLGRLLVGVLLLGVLLVRSGWLAPSRREWLLMAGCGVAWFAIYNVALNAAELHLDAGTTSLVVNVGPVFVAVLAGAFLAEGFPRWLVVGALVSLAGVLVIALPSAQAGRIDAAGIALALAAAAAYAVGVVLQKVALRRLPALQVTWTSCAIGALVCLPFSGQLAGDVAAAPLASTLGMIYLGAVPTALAFTTWAYALARSEAGRLGVTTYLVPPITVLIALVVLGEAPRLLELAGGAICAIGVALSRIRGRRAAWPAAPARPAPSTADR